MKTLIQFLLMIVLFAPATQAQTYTLNWGSSFAGGAWPNLATSRNAANVGGSGINCQVQISKSGGVYTTVYGSYGGPATPTVANSTFIVPGSSHNLQLSLEFTTATQYCDVVFTFTQPVFNVSFNIADIDRLHNTLNYYYDKITVTGYIGAISGGASITKYDATTDPNFIIVSGNSAWVNTAYGVSGNTLSDATDQKGTVRVNFGGAFITSFRVRYENVTGVAADPSVQNIAIGNISFQKTVPLPVTLQSFEGSLNENNSAMLSWKTSEEKDFDFFAIERSHDGSEFEEIGMVQSAGSANSYHYTDNGSVASKRFYRLKMFNVDGSFGYSKTIVLTGKNSPPFRVFPTLVNQDLNLVFQSDKNESLFVEVSNMAGQLVYREMVNAIKGNNHKFISLPANLSRGHYYIRLENEDRAIAIMKQ